MAYSPISLSRYRNFYLKSFDATNQISMQGEVNFFVDSFLEILKEGQNLLKYNLSNKIEVLNLAKEKSQNDQAINKDKSLLTITNLAIELSLFGFNDYLDIDFLKKHMDYTDQTLRNKLNHLVELGILEKISKNPMRCILNRSYLEE